jgi:hypothetical protein
MSTLIRLPARDAEKPVTVPLAAREVYGNLVFSDRWVTAWHKAAPVQWPFRPDKDRQDWMLAAAAQYATLVGHRVIERVTSRPYPITDWARSLNERTPQPAVPGDGDTWSDFLERRQLAMYDAELAEKEVYIGVRFIRRAAADVFAEMFRRGRPVERDRVAREADRIAALLRGGALNARPLTGSETEWLLHRSVSLGLPVPYDRDTAGTEHWVDDDLAAITDGVYYEATRFGRSVKVTSRRADRVVSRYVSVASLGQMTRAYAPELSRAEWLHALDMLPFPVERVSTFDVVGPDDSRKHVKNTLLAIRDQQKHYRDHDFDVPDDLARRADLARRIDSELTDNKPATAVRLVGFHRIAVAGDTEEETMTRMRAVTDKYRNRIAVHIPPSQLPYLREFIPGEPLGPATHLRRMNALFYAAGAPTASGSVGDRVGDVVGILDGSVRQPVMFDPWLGPEHLDSPGMYPVVGTLGAGKSTLIGKMVNSALYRGVRTVVFDPSVTFAGLAQMRRWAGSARVLDLRDPRTPDGILNPFALVPHPNPDDYTDEGAYTTDVKLARAERFQLVLDVCQRLIPPQYRQHQDTDRLLRDAVRSVDAVPAASLWDVVKYLNTSEDAQGPTIGRVLSDVYEMTSEGRLFFPAANQTVTLGDTLLTVLTIGGLQLPPPGADENTWSPAERVAVPVLALATGFASRLVYSGERATRKLLVLDEMHVLGQWTSGRAMFNRLSRDSRKYNVAVLAAGQNPRDALDLDVQNLIGGAFVGRVNDVQTAAEALRLLQIPTGVGYEQTVRELSPVAYRDQYRQFLMLDVYGRVGIIQVTFDDDPELLAALNTRPGGST